MIEVPFVGPDNEPKLYFVGEAPGLTEEQQMLPFVGWSGQLLNNTLLNNGIRREECRIGNVMRVRPRGNDFQLFYDGKEPSPELVEGIRYLKEDIKRCKPSLVVCLGNEAWKAVSMWGNVGKWRGSVVWSEELNCKVMPTYHPALVLRQWDYFILFSADLKKASEECRSRELVRIKRNFELTPSFQRTMEYLEQLKSKRFSFDLETMSDESRHITVMNCIGFSTSKDQAFCLPFMMKGTNYWTVEEESAVMCKLKELMESSAEKIAQNAQFDMGVLEGTYGIKVNNLLIDTMCAHHVLYPEMGKGLDVLCSIYTDQPYYKYKRTLGSDLQFWEYNCLDACITFEVAEKQLLELKEENLFDFYNDIVHPLIRVLLDVQLRGIRIDEGYRSKLLGEYQERIKVMEQGLKEVLGRDINVNSPKQLAELLYGEMGLPKKIRHGKVTTGKDALEELAVKYPSPLFDFIIGLRHLYKMVNTYIDVPLKDGRMHVSYNIGGRIEVDKTVSAPETGRLSSSESIIFATGTNAQNIPREGGLREMFIPDDGYVLIGCDGRQAEARVVAYLADEKRMIDVFETNGDIHRINASWIYEKDPSQISKEERFFAKSHVHAFNYGESFYAFAKLAGISRTDAEKIQNKYFDTFPNIKLWQLSTVKQLEKTRTLTNPFGRRRIFFGRWGEELFREALAHVPQSSVGDWANIGIVKVERKIIELKFPAQLMLQMHDGIYWQVLLERSGEFIPILREGFDIKMNIGRYKDVTIPLEITVGKNWGDMMEFIQKEESSNIVVDKDGVLIEGHERLAAHIKLEKEGK